MMAKSCKVASIYNETDGSEKDFLRHRSVEESWHEVATDSEGD
jgi:hypothetical protein